MSEINDSMMERVSGGNQDKPSKKAPAGFEWYLIKKGENLVTIARKYGTTDSWLYEVNKKFGVVGVRTKELIWAGYWMLVPKL